MFHRNISGDDLLANVIGDMWNIAILIVTPIHKKPVALFHNKDVPDVVIVANGGDYMSNDGSTHFSVTRCYEEGFKLPVSEYRNPTLAQDLSSKLSPIFLMTQERRHKWHAATSLKSMKKKALNYFEVFVRTLTD